MSLHFEYQIPSENDISAPNAEINAKIGLLRTKYTCHADDGSDYCWVSGKEKQNIALGHAHFNLWAAAWVKGDANADTPPNHAIFSGKGNGGRAPPSILQKCIAANAISFAQPLLPPWLPLHHIMPMNRTCSFPRIHSPYNLDDYILEKLTANRYKNASAFRFIRLIDLEKMEFLLGDIAELQDAVRQWAVPL
ncbi:hypothetical protein DFH08DRAFT_820969 [Mycena albidolilacea]|uniref:Uncharacterized protein n=1 Tax=Mycena albidolilacea TaxID=1033008 RepID=A0AAD6ZBW3_9AGAR|nr:hypothetical protein DFH08DRAFT_820969 [Mycena albidolilacea]